MESYKQMKFMLSELKSPFVGAFDLYLDENKTTLYKKIRIPIQDEKEINIYKEIILSLDNKDIISKYIHSLDCVIIEEDGSYYQKYIPNTINLYYINKDINIIYLVDIKNKLTTLINDIDKFSDSNIILGDWALHNLLYDIDTKNIYNIDLEGFYTNPRIYNCEQNRVDECKKFYYNTISKIENILNEISKLDNKSLNNKSLNNKSLDKVINMIKYVKSSGKDYSADHIDIGYHSIELNGNYYRGQRDCVRRLEYIHNEVDVTDKNIMDIGCCVGGMLFPLSDKIKSGVGIDFNYKNVNAGNKIAHYKNNNNIIFYQFDLDKENHQFINNFIDDNLDIVFLFSVCMWIRKWKELINYIHTYSNILFIETNGSDQQQIDQLLYCKSKYREVKQLYERSEDDPGQKKRKLYICRK